MRTILLYRNVIYKRGWAGGRDGELYQDLKNGASISLRSDRALMVQQDAIKAI